MTDQRQLIAERVFKFDGDGATGSIRAQLYCPVQFGSEFKCEYEIETEHTKKTGHAVGVDGLQALILAIGRLGVELYTSKQPRADAIYWLEEGKELGLLLPSNLSDMYRGADPPV